MHSLFGRWLLGIYRWRIIFERGLLSWQTGAACANLMVSQQVISCYIVLLLLTCRFFILHRITWVMPNCQVMLCQCWSLGKEPWKGALKFCRFKEVQGSILAFLMLCTWTEKSLPTFMGNKLTLCNFKLLFLKTIYEWSSKSNTF